MTQPGTTQLTRMLSGPSSRASMRVTMTSTAMVSSAGTANETTPVLYVAVERKGMVATYGSRPATRISLNDCTLMPAISTLRSNSSCPSGKTL